MSMCNALNCCIGGARATGGMALYVHGQLHTWGVRINLPLSDPYGDKVL